MRYRVIFMMSNFLILQLYYERNNIVITNEVELYTYFFKKYSLVVHYTYNRKNIKVGLNRYLIVFINSAEK